MGCSNVCTRDRIIVPRDRSSKYAHHCSVDSHFFTFRERVLFGSGSSCRTRDRILVFGIVLSHFVLVDTPPCALVLYHDQQVRDAVLALPEDPYGEVLLLVAPTPDKSRRGRKKKQALPTPEKPLISSVSTKRTGFFDDVAIEMAMRMMPGMEPGPGHGRLSQAQTAGVAFYLGGNGYTLRSVSGARDRTFVGLRGFLT